MCSSQHRFDPPGRCRGTPRLTAIALPVNLIGLAALVALGVSSLGCGKKGDPMPAPRTIPQAATDLKVRQRGLEVVAEFAYPKSTVAGLPLPAVDEVTLFVLERPLASAAPAAARHPGGTGDLSDPWRRTGDARSPRVRAGSQAFSRALGRRARERHLGRPDQRCASGSPNRSRRTCRRASSPFALTLPAGELSDWSNLAGLLPRLPPAATDGVFGHRHQERRRARMAGRRRTPAGGAGAAGYNLYRRDAARTSYGEPIATLDATASTTVDSGVDLRPALHLCADGDRHPGAAAESALSVEREIDYQDRFAPLPPAELSALGSVGEVRLVWQASPDPDVAGYVIERGRAGCANSTA